MDTPRTGRGWLVTLLIWVSAGLILVGFARLEREFEKRRPIQFLHDGTATAWQASQARLIGGSGSDVGRAIARSPDGDIYILSRADAGLLDPGTPAGHQNVFLFRLDGETGEIESQTSIGGSGYDDGVAIVVEEDGDVLIAGTTESVDFPAVRLQPGQERSGQTNSFVVRFDADLTAIRRNVLLGGDGHTVVRDMLVDRGGSIYLTGSTSAPDFPATRGAYQAALAERQVPMEVDYGADGFLLMLDESLLNVRAATLFGGDRDDYPYILRRAANGSLVVAGNSASTNFPVTADPGASLGREALRSSLFVSVFNGSLTRMLSSAHWGSDTSDFLRGMDVAADGRVHLCGQTNSGFFPLTADASASAHAGGHFDMVYAILSPDLSSVDYSTYLGGGNNDFCHGLRVLDSGEVLLVGETSSVELLGAAPVYPGEGSRGTFIASVEPGRTSVVASLKSTQASIVYGTFTTGEDLWLTGFTAATDSVPFAREVLPTRPGGRDILYMKLSRQAEASAAGSGEPGVGQ